MSTMTEPVGPTTPTDGADTRGALVIGSLVVAVIMVIALVVVTQVVALKNPGGGGQGVASPTYLLGPSARAAAAAAETEVKATLTYSYKTLQADFATAERGLTARFKPSYAQTTTTSVTPLATKYHATSSASVRPAGVSQAGPNTVTLLLFVDQTVTNTQLAQPRLDRSRIKVTMKLVNGHWLVDNLQPL